jgi:hypothetical protein
MNYLKKIRLLQRKGCEASENISNLYQPGDNDKRTQRGYSIIVSNSLIFLLFSVFSVVYF